MSGLSVRAGKIKSADEALGLTRESDDDDDGNVSGVGYNSNSEGEQSSDEEDVGDVSAQIKKRSHFDAFESNDEDDEDDDNSQFPLGADKIEKESLADLHKESKNIRKGKNKNEKLKKLTAEQLQKHEKRIRKTGVVYFSKIPPYMKPSKMRQILSRFGEVDRLFLKPEDLKKYQKRVKYGGNKKRNYEEGWAEFINKSDAKLCVETLNGNKLGGKKNSFYYDDIMNVKYLPGFKWTDLTEQISKENEMRAAKLQAELSQANKLNKTYIRNIEKSKMVENIQKKKKQKAQKQETNETKEEESHSKDTNDDNIEVRRMFTQRNVISKRADAPEHMKQKQQNSAKLENVLSNIF
ncbi:hypothetical protein PACTADRAFT_42962 [Pachysolen tannophilus NRRL Y-2460]|uniref:Pre-rRNA-processing protein ESF2 n=1 Tax=Pachysolen tannophilus NRRL Y-2460 TaxID=669874 RepID=A0A1E4TUT9_PACTA|nr:hypothetical protein PACTADRAFT_42962 [Pachysolen tannophilus NRRL Y-2460]